MFSPIQCTSIEASELAKSLGVHEDDTVATPVTTMEVWWQQILHTDLHVNEEK